jgi:hypothetical protein
MSDEPEKITTELPDLKQDGRTKFYLEKGQATVSVERLTEREREGMYAPNDPFVLIHLKWHGDDEWTWVWEWWTDHYWSCVQSNLPWTLEHYSPAPKEIWDCLVEAVSIPKPEDIPTMEKYDG